MRGLARASGFSASLLSQLENGLVSPSIHSMERISNALGVSLAAFFSDVDKGVSGAVTRVKDRGRMASTWSHAQLEALSGMNSGQRLEPFVMTLQPEGRSGPHPVAHPNEQFALVLNGRAILQLDAEEYRLRRGDAVTLLPTQLRLWTNTARVTCSVLMVTLHDSQTTWFPRASP